MKHKQTITNILITSSPKTTKANPHTMLSSRIFRIYRHFLLFINICLQKAYFRVFWNTPCRRFFFFFKFCQQLWTNWFSKLVNCITLVKLYLPTSYLRDPILSLLQQKVWEGLVRKIAVLYLWWRSDEEPRFMYRIG